MSKKLSLVVCVGILLVTCSNAYNEDSIFQDSNSELKTDSGNDNLDVTSGGYKIDCYIQCVWEPNTVKITTAFNELILTIKQFNTKLNGVLVDVSRKPLNDDQISQIYVHLKKLEKIMQEKKIPSGSDIAQKMFN